MEPLTKNLLEVARTVKNAIEVARKLRDLTAENKRLRDALEDVRSQANVYCTQKCIEVVDKALERSE